MQKMTLSPKFAKFAEKTTRGKFDEARKAESMATGCPLPIDTTGVAVIGDIICKETKQKADGSGGDPMVMIKLEVESPEEYRGTVLQGPGLLFVIKDGPKSTQEDAWGRMLDTLESFGLPRKIRTEYETFEEILAYFTDSPRKVQYLVKKDDYTGNRSGKIIQAYEATDMEEATESADEAPISPPETKADADTDAEYVMYLGKKHKILAFDAEAQTYDLESPVGRKRPGVKVSDTKEA